jgi:hypothetical protein
MARSIFHAVMQAIAEIGFTGTPIWKPMRLRKVEADLPEFSRAQTDLIPAARPRCQVFSDCG